MNKETVIVYEIPNMIFFPAKFPYVDTGGDVWINGTTFMTASTRLASDRETIRPATEEEEKLYWRYHKAWKLMNK